MQAYIESLIWFVSTKSKLLMFLNRSICGWTILSLYRGTLKHAEPTHCHPVKGHSDICVVLLTCVNFLWIEYHVCHQRIKIYGVIYVIFPVVTVLVAGILNIRLPICNCKPKLKPTAKHNPDRNCNPDADINPIHNRKTYS